MTTAGKSHPLAIGGLITLTLIWSYSWIAMKQVTHYIGAFDFTALRCSFGALLLFIVLLLRGRGMRPTPFGYTLAIALLQTCGMVGLSQWALVSGGAGKVAILSYTMPFWVVIMAAIFLGERMRHNDAECNPRITPVVHHHQPNNRQHNKQQIDNQMPQMRHAGHHWLWFWHNRRCRIFQPDQQTRHHQR